ncbi:MAG TPA: nucleoside monophosphate kinase [Candidatus Saccharimonadales bacterium]|nr:nucleoside monophosphate kinase [Candidatus Saccharimonadales bacterium]
MIIIMGSVGSGKSEQTARLAARLFIPRISTSNLLRRELTPEREAKMRAGDLVDDQEVIDIVEPALQQLESSSTDFILDGFPRSVPQAEWLVKKVKSGKIKLGAIIKLDVSGDVVLKRMLARGRYDDKKEIILHRLETYNKITTPVIDYLRSQGLKVDEVNGENTPDAVEAAIKKILET